MSNMENDEGTTESDSPGHETNRTRLELTINTRDGVFIRSVAESAPLPEAESHGLSVESAVVNAMSTFGLPDFAFPSSTFTLGSGNRELGDGILLTYPYAAVIQVKARLEVSENPERETSWLNKHIAKANRQVDGTLRKLRSEVIPKVNMRGMEILIDAYEHEWLGIVIVEHENIPEGFTPNRLNQKGIILTRADWEFLWEQLRSTVEVLKYIERIGQLPPIPLGQESVRYYQAASLDAETEPEPLPPEWVALGGTRMNGPSLPMAPAGQVIEHYVIRQIMEDLARGNIPTDLDANKLLRAYSALDGISVSQRDQMGSDLLASFSAGLENHDRHQIWSRIILSRIPDTPTPQVVLMAYNHTDEAFNLMLLTAKVELAHDNWLRSGVHNSHNLTVGILLTPSFTPPKPWDVMMVALETRSLLTDEERALRIEITS